MCLCEAKDSLVVVEEVPKMFSTAVWDPNGPHSKHSKNIQMHKHMFSGVHTYRPNYSCQYWCQTMYLTFLYNKCDLFNSFCGSVNSCDVKVMLSWIVQTTILVQKNRTAITVGQQLRLREQVQTVSSCQ